jgi:hypothetical protein
MTVDNTLYIIAGTKLYQCKSDGIMCLSDLAGLIDMSNSDDDMITIEEIGGNIYKELLLRMHGDYYVVRLQQGNVEIADAFTLHSRLRTKPLIVYFNNCWITCIDDMIMSRNSSREWETLAMIPTDVSTDSTLHAFTSMPLNLVIQLLNGCRGELVLLTTRELVIFNERDGNFEEFQIVSGNEELNFIAKTEFGIVLGTDYGRYMYLRE